MEIKKFLSFFIAFNLSVPTAFAVEVISKSPSVNPSEFQRFVESLPNTKSLQSRLLDQSLSKTEANLKSKYELAVKGLLLEDLKPSIFVFKEMVSFQKKALLSEASSNLVAESYFRLANLERENSDFWIKHALFFNPDYKPSTEIFNPQIVASHQAHLKENNRYLYLLAKNDLADSSTLLFSNGNRVHSSLKVHPSAQYNLSFYKEGFEILKIKGDGQDLTKFKQAKLKPLNLGTCKNPNFIKYKGIQIDKIYYRKNCIRSRKNYSKSNLGIVVAKHKAPPVSIEQEPTEQQASQKNVKSKNIFKKKSTWYIIGASVLAGVLITALNDQNSEPRVVPVER